MSVRALVSASAPRNLSRQLDLGASLPGRRAVKFTPCRTRRPSMHETSSGSLLSNAVYRLHHFTVLPLNALRRRVSLAASGCSAPTGLQWRTLIRQAECAPHNKPAARRP